MDYFARFEKINGYLFRFDTRIYLESYKPNAPQHCIGAVIGKNPGSAKPVNLDKLERLKLDGDKLLPFVGNRFRAAYEMSDKTPPENAFVRVWNLFYICNATLAQAKRAYANFKEQHVCSTESDDVPLVWFAWGGYDKQLNPFKQRFLNRTHSRPFFLHTRTKKIQQSVPLVNDPARHTQGMEGDPVERHLSEVL